MLGLLRAGLQQYARLSLRRFPQVAIHPTAKVNYRGIRWQAQSQLSIGEGSIVQGQIVAERPGVTVSVGRNTFIGSSTIISAGAVEVGSDVLIAWGTWLVDHDSHSLIFAERRDDVANWYRGGKDWTHISVKPVRVMPKAWIGFNVIVLKGVTIGEGAVVGAGSVVTRDVAPYTLVAGNPARVIKQLTNDVGGGG